MSRAIRFFGALMLALFAASAHAQTANIESVVPISGGTLWYFSGTGPGGLPTAADVCQQSNLYLTNSGRYVFVGTAPNCCGYAAAGYRDCVLKDNSTGQTFLSGTAIPVSNAVCPAPPVNPTVLYTYNPVTGMCERPVQNPCPVTDLPTPPPFTNDKCSQALEDNAGLLPDPAVCQNSVDHFDVEKNNKIVKCVASKLGMDPAKLPVTATYRTNPYQKHLYELWNTVLEMSYDIVRLGPQFNSLCIPVPYDHIVEEWRKHGLASPPSSDAGSHGQSRAIDVTAAAVTALREKAATYSVTTYTIVNGVPVAQTVAMSIEDYINSPSTECNDAHAYCSALPPLKATPCIKWGGNFTASEPDRVHFQFQQ
jgi:hypothetical protein